MKTKGVQKLFSSKSYQTKNILATTILFLVSLACYWNKFANQFVWDDHEFIEEDPAIRSLGNIPSFFVQPVVNLYRPLRSTLYTLVYLGSGTDPLGYHFVGVALHFLCLLLLFFLLRRLGISQGISLAAALLFAVHPVHTEAVTFITASFDLLGPFFFLLSLSLYLRRGKWEIFSWFCYAFSLLSSEMAVTLPFLLILTSLLIEREKPARILPRMIPFALIAAGYLLLRFVLLKIGARDSHYLGWSAATTFLTMTRAAVEYLRLLLWPFPLLADYRHFPLITKWADPSFFLSALFLVGTTAVLWLKRKEWPWALLGWLWIWISLSPVSNLIPTGNVMSERYLYLPSISLCFMLAQFLSHPRKWKSFSLGAVFALFMGITCLRNFDWHDDVTLWTKTSLTAPESFVAHNNLGSNYIGKALYNSAYEEIIEALKIKPDFVDAHTNLGALFEKRGMWAQARQSYENAIAINPRHAPSHNNLGNMFLKEGNTNRAREEYRQATEINPRFYLAYYNLGNISFQEGKLAEAESLYKQALSIQPRFADAQYNLAVVISSSSASPQE